MKAAQMLGLLAAEDCWSTAGLQCMLEGQQASSVGHKQQQQPRGRHWSKQHYFLLGLLISGPKQGCAAHSLILQMLSQTCLIQIQSRQSQIKHPIRVIKYYVNIYSLFKALEFCHSKTVKGSTYVTVLSLCQEFRGHTASACGTGCCFWPTPSTACNPLEGCGICREYLTFAFRLLVSDRALMH